MILQRFIKNPSTFNIELLLVLTPENSRMLKEVKKPTIFEPNTQVFDKEGLFSTEIFGPVGSTMRKVLPGYIDLGVSVIHPEIYDSISQLGSIYASIMSGEQRVRYNKITRNFDPVTDEEEGQTGYKYFLDHYFAGKISFMENDSSKRQYNLKIVENGMDVTKTITKMIVLPAGLRDYTINKSGRGEEDEVNTLYRKVLAITSMVKNTTLDDDNLALLDPMRFRLQMAFNEIYNHFADLMDGKNKFLQSKFSKRAIMFGTRNVITSTPNYITDLKSPTKTGVNHTIVGIYQFIKSITPIAANKVINIFISRFMNPTTNTAILVNPKTMKTEIVDIPVKKRDDWISLDGLNNLFNKFAQDSFKSLPVKINGYYLMLIYDDGKNVKYYFNTDDIDEKTDRKYIRPITYIELVYMAIYDVKDKYPAFLTRYPVAALGGIYPSYQYVKTTINGRTVNFSMDNISKTVYEYPKLGDEYVNSMSISQYHLKRAGADYDGDMMSSNGLLTAESIAEVKRILNTKEYYITPDGEATYTIATDTLEYVMAHLSDTSLLSKVYQFQELTDFIPVDKLCTALTKIYNTSFGHNETVETFKKWLETRIYREGDEVDVVANGKGDIYGYGRYREFNKGTEIYSPLSKTKRYGFISDLASVVKGTGTKILNHILTEVDTKKIDVMLLARTESLIPYYEKFGFKVVDAKGVNVKITKPLMVRYAQ